MRPLTDFCCQNTERELRGQKGKGNIRQKGWSSKKQQVQTLICKACGVRKMLAVMAVVVGGFGFCGEDGAVQEEEETVFEQIFGKEPLTFSDKTFLPEWDELVRYKGSKRTVLGKILEDGETVIDIETGRRLGTVDELLNLLNSSSKNAGWESHLSPREQWGKSKPVTPEK